MDSDSQLCFSHQYEYVYLNFTENFERCYVCGQREFRKKNRRGKHPSTEPQGFLNDGQQVRNNGHIAFRGFPKRVLNLDSRRFEDIPRR